VIFFKNNSLNRFYARFNQDKIEVTTYPIKQGKAVRIKPIETHGKTIFKISLTIELSIVIILT
jgi:hypothetical protein